MLNSTNVNNTNNINTQLHEINSQRSVSNTILRTVQQNEEHNIQIPVSERGLWPKQFEPNVQYSPMQPNTRMQQPVND